MSQFDNYSSRALAKMLVAQLNSADGVASAMNVHYTTVYKWLRGTSEMRGSTIVAAVAILTHPADYACHSRRKRQRGRPPKRGGKSAGKGD